MYIKSSYQTLCLTFLVWLKITVLINCTSVNEQSQTSSANKVRAVGSKQYNKQFNEHKLLGGVGVTGGKIAKYGQEVAMMYGEDKYKSIFSHVSKTAGKDASFHISKANRMEKGKEGSHQQDYKIHRNLAQKSIEAGRLAKTGQKEADADFDPHFKGLFSVLSTLSGKTAAYHISKANQLEPASAHTPP